MSKEMIRLPAVTDLEYSRQCFHKQMTTKLPTIIQCANTSEEKRDLFLTYSGFRFIGPHPCESILAQLSGGPDEVKCG